MKAAMSITDPSARRSVLVRIAGAQSSMNDNPSARITLRLAQQSAETIKTEMDRHFGLWHVAKLQAKTGDIEPARQTFARIIRAPTRRRPGTGCPFSGRSRWPRTRADSTRTPSRR